MRRTPAVGDSPETEASPFSVTTIRKELANMFVRCPQCGLPAEITDRFTLAGTSGPVEHVRTVCVGGHWFTPLVDDVEELVMPASPLSVDDVAIRRRAPWTRSSRSPKREPCRPLPPPNPWHISPTRG
jgi:hypothetical protein